MTVRPYTEEKQRGGWVGHLKVIELIIEKISLKGLAVKNGFV